MIKSTYLDTSVYGGYFDEEFSQNTVPFNEVDILASWNFKYIVNIDKIRDYNSVSLRLGYPILEIRKPREIFMMNKKVKTAKGVVKQLRTIRDKINQALQHLTPEKRTEYFRKLRIKNSSPQDAV